jgi:hypothetical protein
MKYRKKPVIVDVIKNKGNTNADEVAKFFGQDNRFGYKNSTWTIITKTGIINHAQVNDWIIKQGEGDFYSCKPDIFARTHEKVE